MIQTCSICKKIYGEKAPYEDKRVTHGYCKECFAVVMEEISGYAPANGATVTTAATGVRAQLQTEYRHDIERASDIRKVANLDLYLNRTQF